MALTAEQQAQVDVQIAIQTAIEDKRHENNIAMINKNQKFETLRMAKDILIENSRTLPVESRQVTTANVIVIANELLNYSNT
jgi:hypothetical protein